MIKGIFSENGCFHASYINKLGKTEVQIHPIKKNELDQSLALTFPVPSSSEIVHLEWINIDSQASKEKNGQGKRRRADNTSTTNSIEFVYLVVILKNGSIMIYSPFRKELVNQFQANPSVISCCSPSSRLRNAVWILYTQEAVLVELNEFKTLERVHVSGKNLKNLSNLKELQINGNDYLLIASEEGLSILDIASKKVSNAIQLENAEKIRSIITTQDNFLIASDSNQVYIISLPEFKLINTISYSTAIQSLFSTKSSSFGIILEDLKLEIVSNFANGKKKPVSKSIALENTLNGMVLNSLYQENESQLFVSLFDYELRLELVQARDLKKANHTIDLSQQKSSTTNKEQLNGTLKLIAPRELEFSDEFHVTQDTELISLLESAIEDSFKVLQVLVSNSDKIKSVISQLSEESAQKIFKIISFRLELNPTESTPLNQWLKWLLLSHQSIIANPANKLNLKNLKRELTKSSKNLPTFLGLQGRLELLKSQLQLRNQISTSAEEEFSFLEKNDDKNTAESDIVYVNGENDENDEEVFVDNGDKQENGEEQLDMMDVDAEEEGEEDEEDDDEDN